MVVDETMKMVMDDKAIEAIVSMLMELQNRESSSLPLYEKELKDTEAAIDNMLNAIQQGIFNKSTKARLDELEAAKDELENMIACEKLAKPKITEEQMMFWLHRFRKLDVSKKEHRQMLIDTFVNAIYLYDDKMLITFNYKDGTKTITFDEATTALANKDTGSNLDCLGAPRQNNTMRSSAAASGVRSTDGIVFPFRLKPTSLGFEPVLGMRTLTCSSFPTQTHFVGL